MCDLEQRYIGVASAVKGGGEIGHPKSAADIRRISIGDSLAGSLREVKKWQKSHVVSKTWAEGDFVVCDSSGSMASMNSFEHWLRSWVDAQGWPGLRFHKLRHTHATLMLAGGVDVKTLQVRLGHSSADITMSCYAHAFPLDDRAPAEALDMALFS